MLKIDILTLFPQMFSGPFDQSIIKRAVDKKTVEIQIHNLRSWTTDARKTVDARPYGGGVGMVMMVEPIHKAVTSLKKTKTKVILMTPQGQPLNQDLAGKLAKETHLIIICGHYEGLDERVREKLVDQEISIGDYVLTGGELPAMVLVDTLTRLVPGTLTKPEAVLKESFSNNLLEYPQYTRPADYAGWKVPAVLLSGDHGQIKKWQDQEAKNRTATRRPDLVKPKP